MQEINFRDDVLPLKNKLFRVALQITLDRAEAEDIVQETMMRVWSKRDEWQQWESVEAYCLTVAKNLAIDRSERKVAQTVELLPEMEQMPDTLSPHDKLVSKERLSLVRKLIEALPAKQRQIMMLRDVEARSYKEIAELLRITEEQVKVNLLEPGKK